MSNPAKLLFKIISSGRFTPSGPDFNMERKKALSGLHSFVPASHLRNINEFEPAKKSIVLNLRAQAALLYKGLRSKTAHLSNGGNLSYIRIPKSASTSAGSMMLSSKYPELKQEIMNASRWNYLIDANLEKEIEQGHTYFTLVRDPLTRLVSVYHDFFEKPSEHFIYTDYLFGIFRKEMSFHEFVKQVSEVPDYLKDQHLLPQHYFINQYKRSNATLHIFNLENQEVLSDFLAGYKLSLPLLNKTGEYDPMSYYNKETLILARKIYQKDFYMFGYKS